MSPPSSLFKYLPPSRLGVLSDGFIRYSPLGAFNDPFEGRPEITAISSHSQAEQTFQALIPDEAKLAYDKLPREVRRRVSYQSWLKRISTITAAKMPEILQVMDEVTPHLRSLITSKFDETIGILSLTARDDNLLMWSHYAESHAGFVIEFDTHHAYFNGKRSDEDEFGHLRKIEYRSTRPSMPMADLDGTEIFLVKSNDWAYEEEWRILQPLCNAQRVISQEPYAVHLFQVPALAIRSITLGARATNSLRDALVNALDTADRRHIRFRVATPDKSTFRLNIQDAV